MTRAIITFISKLSGSIALLFSFALLAIISGCTTQKESQKEQTKEGYTIEVKNTLDQARTNVFVNISPEDLFEMNLSNSSKGFIVLDNGKEIPSQYVANGEQAGLVLVLDEVGANETRKLSLRIVDVDSVGDYPKRTQAELSVKKGGKFENREYIGGTFENIDSLRVPDEHTDHSWYIRYEGPGWESDLVGYRFYLDWRNGVDVFGKTGHGMELQHVGQDNFDSYHEFSDWGMDVMKVGESLGVGSIASFQDEKAQRVAETDSIIAKIVENGAVYSAVQTDYFGWKIADKDLDLKSVISIHAGTRLSKQHLELEKSLDNIATGLNKDEKAKLFTSEGDAGNWGYIASYGNQSLNNDNLGIAVLFSSDDFISFTEDAHSHVVTLNPSEQDLNYYLLAAWEKEADGIKTEEEFINYLKQTARELANPVQISINK